MKLLKIGLSNIALGLTISGTAPQSANAHPLGGWGPGLNCWSMACANQPHWHHGGGWRRHAWGWGGHRWGWGGHGWGWHHRHPRLALW